MALPTARMPGTLGGFLRGAAYLPRGITHWFRRPGLMALGMVPALVVAAIGAVVIVVLALNLLTIGAALTPFADGWEPLWRNLLRGGVGAAVLLAFLVIFIVGFTTVTLVVGDPVYAQIWRAVEEALGETDALVEPRFWPAARDGLLLMLKGVLLAVGLFLIGLVPLVGPVVSLVLGVLLSGRLVATELLTRPLEARGLTRQQRNALIRRRASLVTGFGGVVHLCFLLPVVAVGMMPAAVTGATLLARELLAADRGPAD